MKACCAGWHCSGTIHVMNSNVPRFAAKITYKYRPTTSKCIRTHTSVQLRSADANQIPLAPCIRCLPGPPRPSSVAPKSTRRNWSNCCSSEWPRPIPFRSQLAALTHQYARYGVFPRCLRHHLLSCRSLSLSQNAMSSFHHFRQGKTNVCETSHHTDTTALLARRKA